MQAQSSDILKLLCLPGIFLDIRIISVLSFLKLLQPLPYTFHQLRYLTAAKKQYNYQ